MLIMACTLALPSLPSKSQFSLMEPTLDNTSALRHHLEKEGRGADEQGNKRLRGAIRHFYYEDPLDLNSATQDDLNAIPFLAPHHIINFLEYRKKHGKLLSIYEIELIRGFDRKLIERLLPFVQVGEGTAKETLPTLPDRFRLADNNLILRYDRVLEKQAGFHNNGAWIGSPGGLYLRYRRTFGDEMSVGMTAEKDPGEAFFGPHQKKGFDFYSGHFYAEKVGPFKKLVLGDYQTDLGQGITFSGGNAFNFGNDPAGDRKAGGIDPYTSAGEWGFYRGGALEAGIGPGDLSLFYSNKALDATIQKGGTNGKGIISFRRSGNHRLARSLERKHNTRGQRTGISYAIREGSYQIGVSGLQSNMDLPVLKSKELRELHDPMGKKFRQGGIDYRIKAGPIIFFGESALMQGTPASAHIHGSSIRMHERLTLGVRYRRIPPGFGGPLNALSDNEREWDLGIRYIPFKGIRLKGHAGTSRRPWLSYRRHAPSLNKEWMLRVSWERPDRSSLSLRVRHKDREMDRSEQKGHGVPKLMYRKKEEYRLDLEHRLSEALRLSTRVALNSFQPATEPSKKGALLYQQVSWDAKQLPFSLRLRSAIFETASYSNRFYAYEHDVLYDLRVPTYHGEGSRTYFLLRYGITERFTAWMRAGHWYYPFDESVGTGPRKIPGKRKTELKWQIRWKF